MRGGFFAFMLVAQNDASGRTLIDLARDPARAVTALRSKQRSARSPVDWRIVQWAGPFFGEDTARHFVQLWTLSGKSANARMRGGAQLALRHDIECFSMHAVKLEQLLSSTKKYK